MNFDFSDELKLLREQARLPVDQRYSAGQRWGERQEQLLGKRLAEGLDFDVEGPDDCWDDLARGVTIAEKNLDTLPNGIAVSDVWVDRIKASAEAQGASWLHALMLATALLDRGDKEGARTQALQSLSMRSTWLAHRLLALLSADVDAAFSRE